MKKIIVLAAILLAFEAGLFSYGYESYNGRGQSCNDWLIEAARGNSIQDVKVHLGHGADPNYVDETTNFRRTPLVWACENGNMAMVRTLIEAGASPDVSDSNGVTPLMQALKKKSKLIADYLINTAGANPNVSDAKGKTVLMYAAEAGLDGIATTILKGEFSELDAKDDDGSTALHYAVKAGSQTLLEKLLDAKINYNISDSDGYTPFMIAMDGQETNMVTVFLRNRNFDVNKSDREGMPPLLWAMRNKHSINMIELVLIYGRNAASVRDSYGDGVWEYYEKYYSIVENDNAEKAIERATKEGKSKSEVEKAAEKARPMYNLLKKYE